MAEVWQDIFYLHFTFHILLGHITVTNKKTYDKSRLQRVMMYHDIDITFNIDMKIKYFLRQNP